MEDSCVVERERVVRVELERVLVVLERLVEAALAFEVDAHVVVDLWVAVVDLERVLVVEIRLVSLALLVEAHPEVDARLVVLRLDVEYALVVDLCIAQVALLLVDHANVEQRCRVVLLVSERVEQVLERLVVVLLVLVVEDSEVEVGLEIGGIDLRGVRACGGELTPRAFS